MQVSKTIAHDKMRLFIKLPSGASFEWKVTRSRESLAIGFSNDPATLQKQTGTVGLYLGKLKGDYSQKFDAIEQVFTNCKTGSEVVAKMEKSLSVIA